MTKTSNASNAVSNAPASGCASGCASGSDIPPLGWPGDLASLRKELRRVKRLAKVEGVPFALTVEDFVCLG
jgi:hypothetical protein